MMDLSFRKRHEISNQLEKILAGKTKADWNEHDGVIAALDRAI